VNLRGLLAPERVLVSLPVATVDAAIERLLQACVASGAVRDPARLAADVRRTHAQDAVTAFPGGFLPHYRTEAVDRLVAALAVTRHEVTGAGGAPRRARLVLLLLAPPREAASYLQAVAAFGRVLQQPADVGALLAAPDAGAVLAHPAFATAALAGPLLVRDVMTSPARSLRPEQPLEEAARELLRLGVEAMPVVGEAGEVIGLLSHETLLTHLVPVFVEWMNTGRHRVAATSPGAPDPAGRTVRDVMTRRVMCVAEDDTVADVAQLFTSKHLDRLPVVREGALCGFLTRADLVRRLLGPAPAPRS
jgi:CBS domain-containing protein